MIAYCDLWCEIFRLFTFHIRTLIAESLPISANFIIFESLFGYKLADSHIIWIIFQSVSLPKR